MRNFNYDDNDDEFKNEIDNFFHDDEEDYEDRDEDDEEDEEDEDDYEVGYSKEAILKAMEMESVETQLDIALLQMTIQMLEKSFWWRFYSPNRQMKLITRSYAIFYKILEEAKKERSKNNGNV
jgi:hypothetical protein